MNDPLTGAIIVVAAWMTCGFLVTLLYFTVWSKHAASEPAHSDGAKRTPSRRELELRLRAQARSLRDERGTD